MTTTNPVIGFSSFRSRLISFLLALLIPVLGGIFYYVNSNNEEYTEETINTYLELGAAVFDDTREQQAATLITVFNSLTWDFGFRTAYAANDPATLFDAALNVLDRSLESGDMIMIVDLELNVVVDTELQGFVALEGGWKELVDRADLSEDGIAEAILTIEDNPYQVIALPLYLPRQVAWIIGGFALDSDFVTEVKDTVVSDLSIVRLSNDSSLEVIESTLPDDQRELLAEQLIVSPQVFNSLQRIDFIEEEFTTLLRPLFGSANDPVQIIAVIQRSYDENNENVVQSRQLLIQFYALIIVISLIAVIFLARSISNPLTRLATIVQRIEKGDYDMQADIRSRDELGTLADSVNSMAVGLAEKEKVRDLLGKVVSHEIAEELLNNPIELGGEERDITIVFSDIRGFTSFCEGLPPRQVLEELNKVLSTISDIIEAHSGVVDKYQGDAVMALFGAPIKGENDARNAMNAAIEIIAALGKMDGMLSACVGVNTGLVVAGNLGSENRLNYSVIGDTVNLSARLESLTRHYGVTNIVSEASKNAAPEFDYREIDEVRVAGKQESVRIYELIAKPESITKAEREELDWYADALQSYRHKSWLVAEEKFSELSKSCEYKTLYQVFLDRITYFKNNQPAEDWTGIFTFGKK
ncbi:MAG: HAMP domain-containing protein [Pseudomonadales bacterium]|nr:HAMP domain-containing protein [Pseudomonadales bacterium]